MMITANLGPKLNMKGYRCPNWYRTSGLFGIMACSLWKQSNASSILPNFLYTSPGIKGEIVLKAN